MQTAENPGVAQSQPLQENDTVPKNEQHAVSLHKQSMMIEIQPIQEDQGSDTIQQKHQRVATHRNRSRFCVLL